MARRARGAGSLLLDVVGEAPGISLDALSPSEWSALYDVAAWHGILPLLARKLRERGAEPGVPPATRRAIDGAYTVAALRAAALRLQLAEALGALARQGVDAALLKGALVGEHLYGDPAVRPMSDVDVLVAPEAMDGARAALGALGYVPVEGELADYAVHRHDRPLVRRGHVPIELHRAIEPCAPPFALPLASVWARMERVEIAGTATRALAPDDLLIHLATHMSRSHPLGTRLVSVCDVAAWTRRFGAAADWGAVADRARAAGAGRFVYAALATARETLAAPVPPDALAAFRPSAADADAVATAALLLRTPLSLPGDATVLVPDRSRTAGVMRVAQAALPMPAKLRRLYGPGDSALGLYLRHIRRGHLRRLLRAAWVLAAPWRWPAMHSRSSALRRVRQWGAGGGP